MSFIPAFELLAVLASAIGVAGAAISSKYSDSRKVIANSSDVVDSDFESDLLSEARITEVRAELARQEFRSKWTGFASTSLRTSQYIIGGVLASSFVQESIDANLVGTLGVIVLVSSLINQHFRPDVRHRGSRQRVVQLRSLLRHAEDDKYAIDNNIEGACSIYEIRKRVSSGLNQIEEMELIDITSSDVEGVDG